MLNPAADGKRVEEEQVKENINPLQLGPNSMLDKMQVVKRTGFHVRQIKYELLIQSFGRPDRGLSILPWGL